jgi:hypothetical protein
MTSTSASCSATAIADDTYALTFQLQNRGAEAVNVELFEPFLQFEILAEDENGAVEVHQPALDIPVNSTSLTVPAGGTASLQTPVRLRLRDDADPGSDGFVWTVQRAAGEVALGVHLTLPEPFDLVCPLELD